MPNPVQIILNASDFMAAPDKKGGGPRKEFYPHDDKNFQKHRDDLKQQAKSVQVALSASPYEKAGVMRVALEPEAIAKSHRPVKAIVPPSQFPCVGAGTLGEMFYFVTETTAGSLANAIDAAENNTTEKRGKNGKPYFAPSDARSEVGAIQSLTLVAPEDKRRFSIETSLSWLASPTTLGGYLVELFPVPRTPQGRPVAEMERLAKSLNEAIVAAGPGTRARSIRMSQFPLLEIRLERSEAAPQIETTPVLSAERKGVVAPIDLGRDRHEALLDRLAKHPLVKRIALPFQLVMGNQSVSHSNTSSVSLPLKTPNVVYPRVGVIDNGVSDALGSWIVHRHDFLGKADVSADHGTFIAGLMTNGKSLNGAICPELDGCEILDVPLFPSADFKTFYKNGFGDFLEEVEAAVSDAVSNHNVRVFNLSINVRDAVESGVYSYFASRLDDMSDRHGVVFVNSIGNLDPSEFRAPWPKKAKEVLAYFANRTDPDTILKPSESVRTISVGAINPPGCDPHILDTPTTYTRRGPGLRVGQKPDLAHYGGSQGVGHPANHGLKSLDVSGSQCGGCGTSFAAPLVAKTIAALDARTMFALPTRALRAFAIHGASTPQAVANPRLRDLARQFIGFGAPAGAEQMVETDDHSITLVFSATMPENARLLDFPFSWPPSLVAPDGSCTGRVRMTLVYDSPLDSKFGSEVVRVNLDAYLRQRIEGSTAKGKPKYESRVDQCYLPKTSGRPAYERELINQGLKWWPVKRYEKTFPEDGVGASSEWLIQVDSLVRAEAQFPAAGVPFTLIVTIEDPTGVKPVFQEVRRLMQRTRAKIEDIQVTAPRIRTRG